MGVAGGAAEPEHRVVLLGLEPCSPSRLAYSLVLKSDIRTTTGLGQNPAAMVPMPSDSRSTKKCSPSWYPFISRARAVRASGSSTLSRVKQRERVGPYVLADDELHPCEADAVAGQERGLEGEVGVAEVDHDLGRGALKVADLGALDAERDLAAVDAPGVALRAGDGHHLAAGDAGGGVGGADDGGDPELAGDDRGVAGAPAAVGDDRGRGLHHRLPVGGRGVGHEHLAGLEVRQLRQVLDQVRAPAGDPLADRASLGQHLAAALERVALKDGLLPLGGDGLGPGLHDVELAVVAVLGPLHVHRAAVVALDRDRVPGQLEDVLVR